jgi:hypothetical protein
MLFCHVLDDYTLQGWLANGKQKEFWKKNAPDAMYEYDYIIALIMHSISWSFMIMLPIAIHRSFAVGSGFCIVFILNTICHAIVDNLKANEKVINLWVDQLVHIWQIAVTAFIFLI